MVDLPEAERPVSQIVRPGCLRWEERSEWEREGCQVMLLQGVVLARWEELWEGEGAYVAILGAGWDTRRLMRRKRGQ